MAFLIRFRGPCNKILEPTPNETFPGELLTLYHGELVHPTANGKALLIGEWIKFQEPPIIHVADQDTLLLFVLFTKR